MDDFNPIDDIRASAAYRIAVAGKLIEKAKLELENLSSMQLFDCVLEDQRGVVN